MNSSIFFLRNFPGKQEGIAYTNDTNWFPTPMLLIAGDTRGVESSIRLALSSYDWPLFENVTPIERKVNSKFFTLGLTDTKAAELTYFGGLLYILYNNDMVIRAYDAAGTLVNEWLLPLSVADFVS